LRQAYRYAVYLAPTDPWRNVGRKWLGRCEESGQSLSRHPDVDSRLDEWTREPRRYGLHATLKPPFRLIEGKNPADLDRAVRAFASEQKPFGLTLKCENLRGFLAWCAADKRGQMRIKALGNAAISELDHFRAPATPAELARRQPEKLTDEEREMLTRWGYPYAFDTFTFHITLTGQLEESVLPIAQKQISALSTPAMQAPMPVNAISIYVQPELGAEFIVARHYGFDGHTRDGAGVEFLHGHAK
jgi:2'-5' RNA ligase